MVGKALVRLTGRVLTMDLQSTAKTEALITGVWMAYLPDSFNTAPTPVRANKQLALHS